MAIIREKQNFQIGTIGVARASNAGRVTGQAISQSANKIGGMLFERAAADAEKAGLEGGQSVDREQVITINPQTGEPEAYEAPEGMGTIATDAYQRVIMSRFQSSIEDEIRNKAKELSVRYEKSSNGVALYTEAMSDYISSMTNVAQDEFRGYIGDVGTSYLNATRTNMAAAQLRRERAAAAAAQRASIAQGIANRERLVAMHGVSALTGDSLGRSVSDGVEGAITDGTNAELFTSEDAAAMSSANLNASTRGLLQHINNNSATPEPHLISIRAAFSIQDPRLIPAEYPELRTMAEQLAVNPSGFRAMEKFSDGVLTESIAYREHIREAQVKSIEAQDEALSASLSMHSESLIVGVPSAIQPFLETLPSDSVMNWVEGRFESFTLGGQGMPDNQFDDAQEAFITAREKFVVTAFEQVAQRTLRGQSTADIDVLQNAIITGETQNLSGSQQQFLTSIRGLETKTTIPLMEMYSDIAQEYSSRAAGSVDAQIKEAQDAAKEAQDRADELGLVDLNEDLKGRVYLQTQNILSNIGGALDQALEFDSILLAKQREAISAGEDDRAEIFETQRGVASGMAIAKITSAAVSDLNVRKTDLVLSAIASDDPRGALSDLVADGEITGRTAESISAALDIGQELGVDAVKSIDSILDSHRNGAARGVGVQEEDSIQSLVDEAVSGVDSLKTSLDLSLVSDIEDTLDSLGELDSGQANTLRESLRGTVAQVQMRSFFDDTTMTDGQASLAQSVLNGATDEFISQMSEQTGESLSPEQISLLRSVRDNAELSPNVNQTLETLFNRLNEDRTKLQAARDQKNQDEKRLEIITTGHGDATDVDNQELVGEDFDERFGGLDQGRLVTDMEFINQNSEAHAFLMSRPVLSTEVLGVFNSLATGRSAYLNDSQMEAVIANWQSIRTIKIRGGGTMMNPAVRGIPEANRAMLDFFSGVSAQVGTDDSLRLSESYSNYVKLIGDTAYQADIEKHLGDSVETFVLDQLDGQNRYDHDQRGLVTSVTLSLYNAGASKRDIEDAVENQLDASFPSGDGIVYGEGMSERTPFALSNVMNPNSQGEFLAVLSRRISSATGNNVQIGERSWYSGIFSSDKDMSQMDEELQKDTLRYFLKAVGRRPNSDAIGYAVYEMPKQAGTGNTLVYEDSIVGEGRDGLNVRQPLVIFSDDPEFMMGENRRHTAEMAQAAADAELSADMELNALQRAAAGTPFDPREERTIFGGMIEGTLLDPDNDSKAFGDNPRLEALAANVKDWLVGEFTRPYNR